MNWGASREVLGPFLLLATPLFIQPPLSMFKFGPSHWPSLLCFLSFWHPIQQVVSISQENFLYGTHWFYIHAPPTFLILNHTFGPIFQLFATCFLLFEKIIIINITFCTYVHDRPHHLLFNIFLKIIFF